MGSKLSIDKHVSNLEDLLELNTEFLDKIKFESNIPDCITQHLKIWKFHENNHPIKKVRSEPLNIINIQEEGFNFLSSECYLVLLIYKKAHEEYNQFVNFPHQMWGVVESYSNLTPRGLECPIAASESYLESFLLPQRQSSAQRQNEFEYMIFVWNGKQANPLIKAQALSNAFELEDLLNKGKDPLLNILFSGGVIQNKKLSKGAIVTLDSSAQSETVNLGSEQSVRETVYLFNFLFPVPEKKKEFSKLADFLAKKNNQNAPNNKAYADNYLNVDLPLPQQQPQNRGKVPALNIPKLDLNCRTQTQEVKIGVPLVEESTKRDGMKLALGNLKLAVREETTYQDIEEEESNGFNFDIRDTDRKKLKIQHFAEICSQVIPDFLYVGGEQIAYNKEVLKQIGVTHVINCAGDVCKNKFPNDFQYLTYYLKDSKTENIECIFYEVITLIDEVKKNNGRVLIHCVQGVSRSVSLCIAYLIKSKKLTYSAAFDIIKKNRGVASPNMGFTVQLLLFQKRLQNPYDSIPIIPRVFAVGRGVSGPKSLVCRMLMDQLYSGKVYRTFDSRGVFLIMTEELLYIWVGPECINQEEYINHALFYTSYLRKFEKAPLSKAMPQYCYKEDEEFWSLWGGTPSMICQRVKDWDGWYDEIDEDVFHKEKETTQKLYGNDKQEDERAANAQSASVSLFYFPNVDDQIQMFDLEDLDPHSLILVFKERAQQLKVFVWKGVHWNGDYNDASEYLHDVVTKHFQMFNPEDILVIEEVRINQSIRNQITKEMILWIVSNDHNINSIFCYQEKQQNQQINGTPNFYHWNLRPKDDVIQYLDQQNGLIKYELHGEFIRYQLDYSQSILLSDLFSMLQIIKTEDVYEILFEVRNQLERLWRSIEKLCQFKKENLNEHYLLLVKAENNKEIYPNSFRIVYLGQPIILTKEDLFQRLDVRMKNFYYSKYKNFNLFYVLQTAYDQQMARKLNETNYLRNKKYQEQQYNLNLEGNLFQQIETQLINHQIYLSLRIDKKEKDIQQILKSIKGVALTTLQKYLIFAVQISMRSLDTLKNFEQNIKPFVTYFQGQKIEDYYKSIILLSTISCDQYRNKRDLEADIQSQLKNIPADNRFPDYQKCKQINPIPKQEYETFYIIGQQKDLKQLYLVEEEKLLSQQQLNYHQLIKDLIYIEFTHLCQNFTLQTFFQKFYQQLFYDFNDLYKPIIMNIEKIMEQTIKQLNNGKFIVLKYKHFQELHKTKLENQIKIQLNSTEFNKLIVMNYQKQQQQYLNQFISTLSEQILEQVNQEWSDQIIKLEEDVRSKLNNWLQTISEKYRPQEKEIKDWINNFKIKNKIFDQLYQEWQPNQENQFIEISIDNFNKILIEELDKNIKQAHQQIQAVQKDQVEIEIKQKEQLLEVNGNEQLNNQQKQVQLIGQQQQQNQQDVKIKGIIKEEPILQKQEQQINLIQNPHQQQFVLQQADTKKIEMLQENEILYILKLYSWQPGKTKEYTKDQLIEQLNKTQKSYLVSEIGQFSKKLVVQLNHINTQIDQGTKNRIEDNIKTANTQAKQALEGFIVKQNNELLLISNLLEVKYVLYKQFWIVQIQNKILQIYKDILKEKFIELQIRLETYFNNDEIAQIQRMIEQELKSKTLKYDQLEQQFIQEQNIDTYAFIRERIKQLFLSQEIEVELFFQNHYLQQIKEQQEKEGETIKYLDERFIQNTNIIKVEECDLLQYTHIFKECLKLLKREFQLRITIVNSNKVALNQTITALMNDIIKEQEQFKVKIEKDFRKVVEDLIETYDTQFNRWKEANQINRKYQSQDIKEIKEIGLYKLKESWYPSFSEFFKIFTKVEEEVQTKLQNKKSLEYDQLENGWIKNQKSATYMFIRQEVKRNNIQSLLLNLESFFQNNNYANQLLQFQGQFQQEITQSDEYFIKINGESIFSFNYLQKLMTLNFNFQFHQQLDMNNLQILQNSRFADLTLFEQLKKDLQNQILMEFNEAALFDQFNKNFKIWVAAKLTNKNNEMSILEIAKRFFIQQWTPEFNEQQFNAICQQSLNIFLTDLEKEYDKQEMEWTKNQPNLIYRFIRDQVKREVFHQNFEINAFFNQYYQKYLSKIEQQHHDMIQYIENQLIDISISKMSEQQNILKFQYIKQEIKILLINQFKTRIELNSFKQIVEYKDKIKIVLPQFVHEAIKEIPLDIYSQQIADALKQLEQLQENVFQKYNQKLKIIKDLKEQAKLTLYQQWKPNYEIKSIINQFNEQLNEWSQNQSKLYDQKQQEWLNSKSMRVYKFILQEFKNENCLLFDNLQEYFENNFAKLLDSRKVQVYELNKQFKQILEILLSQLQQTQIYKFSFVKIEFEKKLQPIYQERLDIKSKQELDISKQKEQWISAFLKHEIEQIMQELKNKYENEINQFLNTLRSFQDKLLKELYNTFESDLKENSNLQIQIDNQIKSQGILSQFEQPFYNVEEYNMFKQTKEDKHQLVEKWIDEFENRIINIFEDVLLNGE